MEGGSILLLLGIAVLAGAFIMRPFINQLIYGSELRRKSNLYKEDEQCQELHKERLRLLQAVQELDLDRSIGKVPAKTYITQREALIKQGGAVLRALSEMSCPHLETWMDAESSAVKPDENLFYDPTDKLEQMIARHRRRQHERSIGFCPRCGSPLKVSDKFCPQCGKTSEEQGTQNAKTR